MPFRVGLQVLRCCWFLASMFVLNGILWVRLLALPARDRDALRARSQRRACRWLCRILGVTVKFVPPRAPLRPSLLAANHLGVLDSVVLASVLDVAFVGKSDIVGWPGIGWVTRTVGLIPVERNKRMATVELVSSVRSRLSNNVSVLVFPEGTTSNGETVRPFKTGAFEAVVGLRELTVLPLCVAYTGVDGRPRSRADETLLTWSGSGVSMFAHCWSILRLSRVSAEVMVGSPVPVGNRDRRELAVAVHNEVANLR